MSKPSIKQQILSFRNRELTSCLEQLGLSKKGRKQELQFRLLAYFGMLDSQIARGIDVVPPKEHYKQDAAARVVQAVYNQMRGISTSRPVAMAQRTQDVTSNWHVEQIPTSLNGGGDQSMNGASNTQIRCICAMNYDRGLEMIQCEAEKCGIWQHCNCVGVVDGSKVEQYFCEKCRAERADPFWEAMHPLVMPPVRLKPSKPPFTMASSSLPEVQTFERTFVLSERQFDLVKRNSSQYRLHIVCLKYNDRVPFRFHWPQQADLRVNNLHYRPYGRNPNSKLGPNARDEQASIGSMVLMGRNRLNFSCVDGDSYLLFIQISRKRSVADVMKLMAPPESAEDAIARVRRVIKGGDEAEGDDDITATSTVVSLRCPLSGSRIKKPVRFTSISSLQSFDQETFLSTAERTRKWQDPNSMKAGTVFELQEDVFLGRVLSCLHNATSVMEIEVSPEAEWRPNGTTQRWRSITEDCSTAAVKEEDDGALHAAAVADSDEESEGAELRAAVAAVASRATAKRKEPDAVINLVSSDDEDDGQDDVAAEFWGAQSSYQPSSTLQNGMLDNVDRRKSGADAGPSTALQYPAGAGSDRPAGPGINIRLPSRAYRLPMQPMQGHGVSNNATVSQAPQVGNLHSLATAAAILQASNNMSLSSGLQYQLDPNYHMNIPGSSQYAAPAHSSQHAAPVAHVTQPQLGNASRSYAVQPPTLQRANNLMDSYLNMSRVGAWDVTGAATASAAGGTYGLPQADQQLPPGATAIPGLSLDHTAAPQSSLNGLGQGSTGSLSLNWSEIIEIDSD